MVIAEAEQHLAGPWHRRPQPHFRQRAAALAGCGCNVGSEPLKIGDDRGHPVWRRRLHYLPANAFTEIDDLVSDHEAGDIVIEQCQFHAVLFLYCRNCAADCTLKGAIFYEPLVASCLSYPPGTPRLLMPSQHPRLDEGWRTH